MEENQEIRHIRFLTMMRVRKSRALKRSRRALLTNVQDSSDDSTIDNVQG